MDTKKMVSFLLSIILFITVLTGCNSSNATKSMTIDSGLSNINTTDFITEWKSIRDSLNIQGTEKVERFRLELNESGKITALRFDVIDKQEYFWVHQIRFDATKKTYNINSIRSESWLQFNRLADPEKFFNAFSKINFDKLPNHSTGYLIDSSGEIINYAVENIENYLITPEGELVQVEELPINNVVVFHTNWSEAYLYFTE